MMLGRCMVSAKPPGSWLCFVRKARSGRACLHQWSAKPINLTSPHAMKCFQGANKSRNGLRSIAMACFVHWWMVSQFGRISATYESLEASPATFTQSVAVLYRRKDIRTGNSLLTRSFVYICGTQCVLRPKVRPSVFRSLVSAAPSQRTIYELLILNCSYEHFSCRHPG